MKIEKSILGVAGEFAVASELCRRNIYAQLTLGNMKRADLLVYSEIGRMARVEVKSKQGRDWPNCKGIYGENVFLVFVDFEHKTDNERPEFYVLSVADWQQTVDLGAKFYCKKHPNRRAKVDEENCLILPDEVNKNGQPYKGLGVRPEHISIHLGAWTKIRDFLSSN